MSASSFLYGGVALAGLVFVGAQLRTFEPPPPTPPVAVSAAATAPAPPPSFTAFGPLTLTRAGDSHFYAEAQVNGAPVRFLVDTGASAIVLTGEDARRAGLGAADYSARGVGAGGEIRLAPVRLSRMTLGPIAADNVPAMVAEEGRLPVSLLGQSFLAKAGAVTIEGDTLTLR